MKDALSRWARELRWAVGWHRRLLAAGLAAGSVTVGLSALSPAPPPTVAVLSAARDLPGGTALTAADLVEVELPPDAAPAGVVQDRGEIEGQLLAAPMRRGEPLTDVRMLGPSLLEGYGRGVVAAPVRIADAAAVRLLRAGDAIDVLAAEAAQGGVGGGSARVVAAGVRVLAVPGAGSDDGGGGSELSGGALVVLATSPDVAAGLARAAVTARLSVTLRAS